MNLIHEINNKNESTANKKLEYILILMRIIPGQAQNFSLLKASNNEKSDMAENISVFNS